MSGRVTLPIESGMDEQLRPLLERLGADAVRNSDGTTLPEIAGELGAKVYSTYFVGRGDQEWALAHPDHRTQIFLMSRRTTSLTAEPLRIRIMEGYLSRQIEPDTRCDLEKYWEVVDQTDRGAEVPASEWTVSGSGIETEVIIANPKPGHVYAVYFLAWQTWDPTQMYNYITNGWEADPKRVREQPYDVRHAETWEHIKSQFVDWLKQHPEVDVVRFTTFFYHFTLVFNDRQKEKFVDWFGYTASVSVAALEAFATAYGYELRPADFVDEGYYHSQFRPKTKQISDWLEFQNRFVTDRVAELTKLAHDAGKEAMMFLGDNWIGTEPYGENFAKTGIDAVVGSVGSAATCRMISDVPGVKYTEGRFLPYFFPDVFREGGDPTGQAEEFWQQARRAIVRSPLDRIGYGGYLSLAVKFPEFIAKVEQICNEFRSLHERTGGDKPQNASFKVAVLNQWGRLRSWQSHMVAHALWYSQCEPYVGVLEALAGLPFEVEFISFEDVAGGRIPEGVKVIINAGAADTAFSGGEVWADTNLQVALRSFVADGGGLIGVGEPTAYLVPGSGAYLQLSDVFGIDREKGWSLSTDRYCDLVADHFITADAKEVDSDRHPGAIVGSDVNILTARGLPRTSGACLNLGEVGLDVVPTSANVQVLQLEKGSVGVSAHEFGAGRAVYFAGLPYDDANSRALLRAIYWAASRESEMEENFIATDPRVEVAYYPSIAEVFVYNNAPEIVNTIVTGKGFEASVTLPARGAKWVKVTKL